MLSSQQMYVSVCIQKYTHYTAIHTCRPLHVYMFIHRTLTQHSFFLCCADGFISEQTDQALSHVKHSSLEVLVIYLTKVTGLCSSKYIATHLYSSCSILLRGNFSVWMPQVSDNRNRQISFCVQICHTFHNQYFSPHLHNPTLVNLNQSPFRTFHFKWFHLTVITEPCEGQLNNCLHNNGDEIKIASN